MLLLDVGIVAVYAGCVVVGGTWEGDSHGLLAFVAQQAVISLGDKLVLRRRELMADNAVDVHLLGRSLVVDAMALVACLLRGLEDVELEPVAADALRLLILREDVDLVTRSVGHLEPLGVLACVAFLAGLVLYHRQLGDRIRVLEYDLSDVVEALYNVCLVAVMAVEIVHRAGIPGLICVVHEVTCGTELRVVLSVVIDEVGWNSQDY